MNRRDLLRLAGAGLGARSLFAAPKGGIIELRYMRLRNSFDNQMQRTSQVLERTFLPAMRRAGAGPMGFFNVALGPDMPTIVYIVGYPSLAALEEVSAKTGEDKEFNKALADYYAMPGLGYVRTENSLLRAFESMPAIEAPPTEPGRAPRVFELRIYESNNFASLEKKIKMFEDGEIAIFRKTGLRPVFFGRTLYGTRSPNLTYLLAFDDMAAREKAWATFIADPEWKKLAATPGLSNAEVVSNISSQLLRPMAFSPIR